MKKITINDLLRGASVLSCGGGLSYAEQLSLIKKLNIKNISLVDPETIGGDTNSVVVAELGPADAPALKYNNLPELLKYYESKTGLVVDYILPGEIGQEAVTITASTTLGLPIVDSDLAGGRAVPTLSDIALLGNVPSFTISPLVIMTSDGKFEFIGKQSSISDDELVLRNMVNKFPGQVLLFIGGGVSGDFVKKNLAYHSYSLAESVGKEIKKSNLSPKEMKVLLGPERVLVSEVTSVKRDGFVDKKVIISGSFGEAEIVIENEYMSIKGKGFEYNFPDLITLTDPDTLIGISSGKVKVGISALLTIYQRHRFWRE